MTDRPTAEKPWSGRLGRFGAGALVALVVVGIGGATSAGQDASLSRQQAARLARQAATDGGALSDLRAVTEIDGQAVDLGPVTVDGPGRTARLRALADDLAPSTADGSSTPPAPADARDAAKRVLRGRKYQEPDVPKPFQGILAWLADRLRPVGDFLSSVFEPILELPGGPFLVGAVFVGAAALLTRLAVARRSKATATRRAGGGLVDPTVDPADLLGRAEEAEAAGDLTSAIRLRYEAGLLLLVRAERLELRTETTAGGAARQVGDPVMDRLTAMFEEVVYGGRPATVADATAARVGWTEILLAKVGR